MSKELNDEFLNDLREKNGILYDKGKKYLYQCSKFFHSISTAQKRMEFALHDILKSFRYIPDIEASTHAEYIAYCVENFILRSYSIYDRALILASQVANTGISIQNISHQLVITNEKIIDSDLDKPLKRLRQACKKYYLDRNQIVHHDKLEDTKIDYLNTVQVAQKILDDPLELEKLGINDKAELGLRAKIITERYDEFEKHLAVITERVNDFFQSVYKEYIIQRNSFIKLKI